jgi:nucleoside-diphosphate-sugar epimerase
MNILITGIAGGIGSTLGYQLYKNGHTIVGVDNFNNGYQENLTINGETYCEFYEQDIRQPLDSIMNRHTIDVVVHLAAITALPDCECNPVEAMSVNVAGTASILDAARRANVKQVIFASTSAVYENNLIPFKESLDVNPRLVYSLSKKLAEEVCTSYVHNYGMNIAVLRFFNVFGPRQDIHRTSPPLINYVVKELVNGRVPVLHSTGDQQRDYIYVDDVTNLIERCLGNPRAQGTFNVCTGQLLSVRQIVDYIQEELGTTVTPVYKDSALFWDKYPALFEGKYPLHKDIVVKEVNKFSLGDPTLAQTVLGWQPNTDLKSLIKQTARIIKNG